MILNSMTLINEVITLITYSAIEAKLFSEDKLNTGYIQRTIICEAINITIGLVIMFIGSRAITFSKKLSLHK